MPAIQKINSKDSAKPKKIRWDEISFNEMIAEVEGLVGKRPSLPKDISAPKWSSQAVQVLKERYFIKNEKGEPVENVAEMCWRVSWEIASAEAKYGSTRKEVTEQAREYYSLLLSRAFLPNSPTLMNAGKGNGLQYSACYVIPVEDSLTGIFDGIKYQALVHQSGGGTGFSFSRLRPAGARVKSTMGVASGPVSFMRVYNEATQQIKQGGMRRGANMGILRVDHPDIMEFIHCKDDGGVTNFNISVTVTDKFMEALAKDEDYELIDPHTNEITGKLSAKKVWDEIANGAWKTGDPGVIFIDRINQSTANPIRKEGWLVESTNPCGEQPLYPFDACNLGSIFLKYFVAKNGKTEVDWEKLKDTVHTAVRFLDSVIEMNPFPLPEIRETVRKIRRIGLGVGGWADMLVELGIPYGSEEALTLADEIMKFINEEGHKASETLAKERGSFPMWEDSIYAGLRPIRNSTVTTIAPTGSIGILADTSSGIEPLFAIAYQHIVKSENRTLSFINPSFENMAKNMGFYSQNLIDKVVEHGTVRAVDEVPPQVKNIFGTAHEIHPDWHVKMQAAFQKYTDNAVSKTINLSHDATVDDIKKAYMLAWETGCRGITVFRDGCKGDQVLNLGVKSKEEKEKAVVAEVAAKAWSRPMRISGATYKIKTPVGTAFITINEDDNQNPIEIFINIGKAGSDIAAMAEALGRLISKSLKFDGTLTARERAIVMVDQLRGIGGRTSVGFGPSKIRSLPDAIGFALATHCGLHTNGNGVHADIPANSVPQANLGTSLASPVGGVDSAPNSTKVHGDICPSCGKASLVYQEGCVKCFACGHSEC